jgi:uncharacterized protein YndB with AHSA1/START domain
MNPVDINDDTIVQEITIKSSAERVFAALSNPDEVVKWWGQAYLSPEIAK